MLASHVPFLTVLSLVELLNAYGGCSLCPTLFYLECVLGPGSPCWSFLGVHRTGDTVAKRMITGKAPPTKQKLCTMAVLIIPVRSQEFFARNAPALLLREYRRFTGGLLKVYLMCS